MHGQPHIRFPQHFVLRTAFNTKLQNISDHIAAALSEDAPNALGGKREHKTTLEQVWG
jgi:hypothetical protein